jgi:hypothetical protein
MFSQKYLVKKSKRPNSLLILFLLIEAVMTKKPYHEKLKKTCDKYLKALNYKDSL